MSGGPLQRSVVIRNPQGFHLRPKAAIARQALQCQSDIRLHWNGQTFDGKSMLDLLLLAAEQGQEVILEATGPDAAEALESLALLLAAPGEEEEPAGPPLSNT